MIIVNQSVNDFEWKIKDKHPLIYSAGVCFDPLSRTSELHKSSHFPICWLKFWFNLRTKLRLSEQLFPQSFIIFRKMSSIKHSPDENWMEITEAITISIQSSFSYLRRDVKKDLLPVPLHFPRCSAKRTPLINIQTSAMFSTRHMGKKTFLANKNLPQKPNRQPYHPPHHTYNLYKRR